MKKTRESVIKMNDRHFTAPVDEISGTVDEVSAGGITLNEFPGRRFQFSSVSTSAADMSARILGENKNLTWVLRPAEPKTPRAHMTEAPPPLTCQSPASKATTPGMSTSSRRLPSLAGPESHAAQPETGAFSMLRK